MQRRVFLGTLATGSVSALAGCSADGASDSPGIHGDTLTLATTTSTYDTGLLDALNVAFGDRFGVEVRAIGQGTGGALETARSGDVDVIMVHARTLEDEFLRNGYGVNRRTLMFNDFVVVGPDDDPAGIRGMDDVLDGFRTIATEEVVFVSRGDNSGTHRKERELWERATVLPEGEWYREAGSGMGEVLNQANFTPGYTLADRGTFLAQRTEIDLEILLEGPIGGGPDLLANPYGIIAVNPGRHEESNYDLAMAYIGFVTSHEGQRIIREYTVDGEQLFFPDAISETPRFEQYVPTGWGDEGR